MSKLEELIEQYCPDGVEYMKIGEVCKTLPKGTLTTKELVEPNGHNYPVINSGRELYGYYTHFNNEGDAFTVAARGEYAGFITYFSGKFWAGGLCYPYRSYSPNISTKFIFYYLKTRQEYIRNTLVAEGSIPALNKGTLDLFEIPVPPLPVQEEIVRVLDAFTELQAELQAELQKRKQQYNFYRDNLLTNYTSEQNVKEYCLGELFEFKNGLNASKEQFGHGKPIVNYVNVYKKNSIVSSDLTGRVELEASAIERYMVKRGDVFFTRTSETREEVGFASVLLENIEDCVFSGFVLRARPITNFILPEFCKYCFATYKIRKQIIQSSTLTTRALTNGTSLSKVKIMIPPIEEQKRIVAILDRFDALTNDLTSGLPAEMEKRRQQYEFYRDKLLTFKRKEA